MSDRFAFEKQYEQKLELFYWFCNDFAPILPNREKVKSIVVFFSKPIKREEIMRRIDEAFKDLA